MTSLRKATLVTALLPVFLLPAASGAQKPKAPSVSMRVSPQVAFAPARITVTAELKDVDETSSQLYCPDIEWEWGDGTTSESSVDCEPFEAGKSEVRKRYTADHTYRYGGRYRVELRLKRQRKTILLGATTLMVREGVRDGFPG